MSPFSPFSELSPEALSRVRRAQAYREALAYAAEVNPGPNIGQLHVPAIPGTNFAGNGENDLANISYALAKAYGAETIVVSRTDLGEFEVRVDSFIDPSSYSVYSAIAMDAMVQHYWSDVGYNPSMPQRFDRFDDWANAVPTREVDIGAYHHDRDEIRFAGNPRAQAWVDRRLFEDANAAAVQDTLRLDLNAARWDHAIATFAVVAADYQALQPPNPQPPPVRPRR